MKKKNFQYLQTSFFKVQDFKTLLCWYLLTHEVTKSLYRLTEIESFRLIKSFVEKELDLFGKNKVGDRGILYTSEPAF